MRCNNRRAAIPFKFYLRCVLNDSVCVGIVQAMLPNTCMQFGDNDINAHFGCEREEILDLLFLNLFFIFLLPI